MREPIESVDSGTAQAGSGARLGGQSTPSGDPPLSGGVELALVLWIVVCLVAVVVVVVEATRR